MRHRTIRLILLLAVAAAAFAAFAAPGFARHGEGGGEDEHVRGTVASFSDGVLTIRQSDGDKVSGKVTRRTEIECEHRNRSRATAVAARHGGDDDNGDDDDHGDDHRRGRGRDDAREHHARHRCGTRQLITGRTVREAELSSTSSGLVFREIELVR
jgi:hypothetical protein